MVSPVTYNLITHGSRPVIYYSDSFCKELNTFYSLYSLYFLYSLYLYSVYPFYSLYSLCSLYRFVYGLYLAKCTLNEMFNNLKYV